MRRRKTLMILRVIPGILAAILVILCLIAVRQTSSRMKRLEVEKQHLEKQVETLKQKNTTLQAEMEQLRENTGASAAQEEDSVEEEQGQELPDLLSIPAGTVLSEEQIQRDQLEGYFCAYPIPEDVFQRINGQSYRENDVIGLEDLRYLKLLHYNFDHQIQMGELIVNTAVAEDVTNIFRELFENEYEVQSMYLIDNYWTGDGDSSDTASIEKNNTSAFCFRTITGGSNLSNHAYGRAIDINPQQNPYVSYRSGSPRWSHSNADAYIDRSSGLPHVITESDICYQIFTKYGFSWGGNWNTIKDYQHFEKES